MAQTPYVETEILLSVMEGEYGVAIESLREMSQTERTVFLENVTDLAHLINAVNQAQN